ncbi:MAG: hypothetical protein R2712_02925 [Vicinamibacterales bacterium]
MRQTPFTSAPRPTVDEWGVYDPQQAGLAALHARLTDAPAPPAPNTTEPARTAGTTADSAPGSSSKKR